MTMSEWAKNEMNLAMATLNNCEDNEVDYIKSCYESAYKAFNSLLEDEHSGISIGVTKVILNDLINGHPLSPIYDTPDIWDRVTILDRDDESYQCKRMSSLFKEVYSDGTVKYTDTDRARCIYSEDDDCVLWSSGLITKLLDEMYPITMPYSPFNKPYIFRCSEVQDGDRDIMAIWSVQKPDEVESLAVRRFFKETESGNWIEISQGEFNHRCLQ